MGGWMHGELRVRIHPSINPSLPPSPHSPTSAIHEPSYGALIPRCQTSSVPKVPWLLPRCNMEIYCMDATESSSTPDARDYKRQLLLLLLPHPASPLFPYLKRPPPKLPLLFRA